MTTEVLLDIGGFHFGGGDVRIRTLLGSCVAITLWHPERRIGGMCHYLLPVPGSTSQRLQKDGLYAEDAVRLFVDDVRKASTQPGEYVVRMFGGGRMFGKPQPPPATGAAGVSSIDVAQRNIQAGHDLLTERGFKVLQGDVGGSGYRQVVLELGTGEVVVRRGPELP